MNRLLSVAWLTTIWVVLWRDADPVNVCVGLALSVALVAAVDRGAASGANTIRPVPAARLAVVFAWKLLEANLRLAREVVTPRNTIETGVIEVRLPTCTDVSLALTANAVSLTPGTLTIEAFNGPVTRLYVHVLHLHDVEAARREVRQIAALVRNAFDVDVSSPPEVGIGGAS